MFLASLAGQLERRGQRRRADADARPGVVPRREGPPAPRARGERDRPRDGRGRARGGHGRAERPPGGDRAVGEIAEGISEIEAADALLDARDDAVVVRHRVGGRGRRRAVRGRRRAHARPASSPVRAWSWRRRAPRRSGRPRATRCGTPKSRREARGEEAGGEGGVQGGCEARPPKSSAKPAAKSSHLRRRDPRAARRARSRVTSPTRVSPFAVRGVLEGFYGNPWTHEQRLELIGFIASRGMNTFVYAPKDDPLHAARLALRLRRAPTCGASTSWSTGAARRGVDFMFCVSPGLTMRYSDEEDLEALCDKLGAVDAARRRRASGCCSTTSRADLQHPEDREAFDTPRRRPRRPSPTTSSSASSGAPGSPSARPSTGAPAPSRTSPRSARGLEPGIDLFWTGRRSARRRSTSGTPRPSSAPPAGPRPTGTTTPSTTWRWASSCTSAPTAAATRTCSATRSASSPTAWSCSRRRRSRSRPSRTTSWRPRRTTPRRAGGGRCATSSGDADLDAFALFADNVRSSCLAADDAPVVTARAGVVRVPDGPGRRAPRPRPTSGRSRTGCWRPPRRTCCAGRSRTGR